MYNIKNVKTFKDKEIVIKTVLQPKFWHGTNSLDPNKNFLLQDVILSPKYDSKNRKFAIDLNADEIAFYSEKLGVNVNPYWIFPNNEPHPFYNSPLAEVRLSHTENFLLKLDTDTDPTNDILYRILINTDFVAATQQKLAEKPTALFFVMDTEENTRYKAKLAEEKMDAMVFFKNLTVDERKSFVCALNVDDLSAFSEDQILVEYTKLIDSDLDRVKELMSKDKSIWINSTLIKRAVDKGILTQVLDEISRELVGYKYMDTFLGNTFSTTIDFLSKPENSKMKKTIEAKVNVK